MGEVMLSVFLLAASSIAIVTYDWRSSRSIAEPSISGWMLFGNLFCYLLFLFAAYQCGVALFTEHLQRWISLSEVDVLAGGSTVILSFVVLSLVRGHFGRIAIDLRETELKALGLAGRFHAYATDDGGRVYSEVKTKQEALRFAEKKLVDYAKIWEQGKEPPGTGVFGFYRIRETFLEVHAGTENDGASLFYEREIKSTGWFGEVRSFEAYELFLAPNSFVLECIEIFYDSSPDDFLAFFKREGAGSQR